MGDFIVSVKEIITFWNIVICIADSIQNKNNEDGQKSWDQPVSGLQCVIV
jgi:hypothetical protein